MGQDFLDRQVNQDKLSIGKGKKIIRPWDRNKLNFVNENAFAVKIYLTSRNTVVSTEDTESKQFNWIQFNCKPMNVLVVSIVHEMVIRNWTCWCCFKYML